MAPSVIVSYDGTPNDHDALALGRMLADAGATLALAYVRHAAEPEPDAERAEHARAEQLLADGAAALPGQVETHVIMSPGTGAGLAALAEDTGADMIVFGSEYRTAPGHLLPGTSAATLLNGGPVAIAIAPAEFRDGNGESPRSIGEISEQGDLAAGETASSLATAVGADIALRHDDAVDLLVLGSQAAAPPGRVALSAAAQYVIETARCPVIVVPRGGRVRFAR